VDSQSYAPLMLLVPDFRAHLGQYSVPFVQIVSLINKIQVISYFMVKETISDFYKNQKQDNFVMIRKLKVDVKKVKRLYLESNELSDMDSPESVEYLDEMKPESPKNDSEVAQEGKLRFIITTIQPVNIYKKVLK